jgi:Abortive infection C-terminus
MAGAWLVTTGRGPVKVYGSVPTFRSQLQKRTKWANDELRGQLDAARDHMRDGPEPDRSPTGLARIVHLHDYTRPLSRVEDAVLRWLDGNDSIVQKYLGGGADEFLSGRVWSPPSRREEVEPSVRVDECQALIDDNVRRLERLLDVLPRTAAPVVVQAVEHRFAEVRQTNLIEESLLDSYIARMSKTRTKPQISQAIGAAKELVEACNRSTLDRLDVSYPLGDFPKLGKLVRNELLRRESTAPSTKSGEAIGVLLTGMATVEQALTTLRNEVGTGHGKPELPTGLRPRHAQLAIDIADTHVRYLVATLADLKLI